MKPFDLDKALSGAQLITRSGILVKHFQRNQMMDPIQLLPQMYPYQAEINGEVMYFTEKGHFIDEKISCSSDLFLNE